MTAVTHIDTFIAKSLSAAGGAAPIQPVINNVLDTALKGVGSSNKPDASTSLAMSDAAEKASPFTKVVLTSNQTQSVPASTAQVSRDDYSDKRGLLAGYDLKTNSPGVITIVDSKGNKSRIEECLIQTVSVRETEKTQIMSMLDDTNLVYFYGDQPTVVGFTGVCLDTYNFQWLSKLSNNYSNELRGTKSIAKGSKIIVSYDDREVEGLVTDFTSQKRSINTGLAEISFSMIVTRMESINYEEGSNLGSSSNKEGSNKSNSVSNQAEEGIINRMKQQFVSATNTAKTYILNMKNSIEGQKNRQI